MNHIYLKRFVIFTSSAIKNWKDTKHINIHENAQNKQRFKNWKRYNQRMRTGGRYDKRKVRHWERHWGRPVQDDYTLLSANDV